MKDVFLYISDISSDHFGVPCGKYQLMIRASPELSLNGGKLIWSVGIEVVNSSPSLPIYDSCWHSDTLGDTVRKDSVEKLLNK